MLLPSVIVKESPIQGRGLRATRDVPRGTVVWHPCRDCRRWTADEAERLPPDEWKSLDEYGYWLDDGGLLLPCSGACWMNHSCDPAVLDFGLDFAVAVRDVAAGEELTCDYRTFTADRPWQFHCRCGTPGCAGVIDQRGGLAPSAQSAWRDQLLAVLPLVRLVNQPLDVSLRDASPAYRALREGREIVLGCQSILAPTFRVPVLQEAGS